jgi:hypothetical protein
VKAFEPWRIPFLKLHATAVTNVRMCRVIMHAPL